MLTLRHYELLVTLAEELHFGRAAERLGISQPQLTLQLKQMEEMIGALLFDRTRRRVALSTAGALLLPEARAVLRHAERAQDVALRVGRGMIGELALGYIGAAAYNGVLTRLVRRYRERAPQTTLQLTLMDLDRSIPEVAAGNLDAGIVRLPFPDLPASLTTRTLCAEPLWIALPEDHPLAAPGLPVALRDLKGEPFIATHLPPNSGFSAAMHRACASAGITPDIVQRSPQFASIVSLVAAGLGVAVVPEAIRHVQLEGVVYKPLDGLTVTADISLVYQTDRDSPPLALLLSCLDDTPL
ncbi:LysR substrate-binding domain-containing protein [Salipiger marinus]|jgi:DNA-binding transcriptional LysR family regulator|uniref:DNA-binding transcriptional regulator, LysR family n=1 Tax=Salipiger marinus TaxID=555512 RepID=A0A1G8KCZ3_9RHOB|nr:MULTISPECIES: LysR substrate-binding domain-containing protein [Salipiger]HBM60033.1 LysR family transcriptional regulator [Citreicella sp.]MCD1618605.1 LysR family transcriptional regulator [Salipiger manganoxidans]MEB3417668.1 LysR substrate-binding domain-containing protein [Salipiger manganoxidans]SDI41274.1 DNA-binding transcriptional regulator, LysR family [Salipiger marinus]HBT02444.1 LysR family transcriptional regulator [Citreicella sp.]